MRDPQVFARLEQDTKGLLQELAMGWTADEIASVRADIDDPAARMNMTDSQHLRALHARAKRLGIDRRRPIARAG